MEKPLTEHIHPDQEPPDLREYVRTGGYRALRKALHEMHPDEVTGMVKESGLKGRGGAGFVTGEKWSYVPAVNKPPRTRYFAVNADEMEPGSFKDRYLLEGNPHQVIEGAILCSYAIQARHAYLFLRWAYKTARKRLERAIGEAYDAGYLGNNIMDASYSLDLHVHASAGRYICGEETALLNALEGIRPNPRSKPPYPQSSGLYGKPTVVNNVETVANVPHIINRGAEWYKGLSLTAEGGTKLYGVSGRVKRPGIWELPMGTTVREIIMDRAGGMKNGFRLRGFLPGGASTDFLTEQHLDLQMDFSLMEKAGTRLGTGTIVILDDETCPVGFVHNLESFFARESCGWCTPCREGLPWIEKILRSFERGTGVAEDLAILEWHATALGPGHTYCAFAPGAAEPLRSSLKYFREDYERHLHEKRCPYERR